jgi:hypothetical protein
MRSFFILVAIVACTISCGLSVLAADEEPEAAESPSQEAPPAAGRAKEKIEVLYTSPSSAWRIERSGENAWIISTKDSTERVALPPLEGISPVDDAYHASPNDEWIFGLRHMAHGFSNGDLFHRVDPQHVEIAPTKEPRFQPAPRAIARRRSS